MLIVRSEPGLCLCLTASVSLQYVHTWISIPVHTEELSTIGPMEALGKGIVAGIMFEMKTWVR